MPITPLPPVPDRSNPATFANTADTFFAALPNLVTEVNALAPVFVYSSLVSLTGASAVDFTGIPADVKEINVIFDAALPNGSESILVQIGTAASWITAGYVARSSFMTGSTLSSSAVATDGFKVHGISAFTCSGILRLVPFSGACICDSRLALIGSGADYTVFSHGFVPLVDPLTRVRVTRIGSNNFTSGNVLLGWSV